MQNSESKVEWYRYPIFGMPAYLFLFFAVSAADTPAGPVPIMAISYRSVFLASLISLMHLYFIKYIRHVNTFDKIISII